MAKQLNVNLAFTADTSQARASIQELQNSLNNIHKAPAREDAIFDSKNIKEASQAALELTQHLQKAVNVDTGKLDLARFSSSLKTSGKTLDSYYNTLLKIGPEGQQAFLNLATAIAQAEAPTARVNKQLSEMWTTMKNTARWQLSSSVLHGFMGTLQSAYGYVQDLNKSLNDIRIVSGQSTDQMAKFAKEANKSAKALSTTTTKYTNASLIYYQQGLSDEEVKERTDITIKMANAAGVSAEQVSNQLTAVWNNFYNGTQSLEYYADVMTALGAATASSTDEIAAGLEKFAAIADTVGLSYEYSTAALATITANTRQSADVVGNALKTLFARIQGLSLGETLEDGVDLNKYSQALKDVGVEVLDGNNQLREMDDILDDLAAKWDTIGEAEQAALAQTVAGVRQYTQLIALMENWDDMEKNLDIAYNATGALDTQAEIYADSWEAASNRVRAAAEGVYDSLINDEFFIFLLNGFEKVLTGVEGLIDGFGGLKGVASITGALLLKQFSKDLPASFRNIRENFMVRTGKGDMLMDEMQDKSTKKINEIMGRQDLPENFKAQLAQQQRLTLMQNKLLKNSKNMSNEEIQSYQAEMDMVKVMSEAQVDLVKQKEEAEKKTLKSKKEISKQIIDEDENVQKARRILAIRQEQEERQRREETLRTQKEEIEKELSQEKYKAKKKKQLSPEIQKEKRKKIEEKKGVSENIKEEVVAQQRLKAEELQLLNDLEKSEINASEENFLKEFTDGKRTEIKKLLEEVETTTKKAKSLSFTKDTFGEDKNLKEIQDKEERKKAIETAQEKARIQSARLKKQFADEQGNIADLDVKNIVEQLDEIAAAATDAENEIESLQEKINALGQIDGRNIINEAENAAGQAAKNLEEAFGEDDEKKQKAKDFAKKVENQVDLENRQTEGAVRLDQDSQASPTHEIKPEEVFGDFSAYAMSTVAAVSATQTFITSLTEGGSALEIISSGAAVAATGFEVYQTATQLASSATQVFGETITLLGKTITISATPLLILAGVLAAAIVIYDKFISKKQALENIEVASSSYETENQKLNELNSQLDNIKKQINSIEPITIVEQSELNKLKALEASLEHQVAAQEKVAGATEKNYFNTLERDFNRATRTTGLRVDADSEQIDYDRWRKENLEEYQNAEQWYSELITAEQEGKIDYNKKEEHQARLKTMRENMFGSDYDNQFLVPLIKEMNKVTQAELDNFEEIDWANKVGDKALDAMGISASEFNDYFKESLSSLPDDLRNNLDELSIDELVTLFDNIEPASILSGQALDRIKQLLGKWIGEDVVENIDANSEKERYSTVSKITDDLDFGSTISAEDYQTLGAAYREYFQIQEDGTYKLITNAITLKEAVEDIELSDLKKSIGVLYSKFETGQQTLSLQGIETTSNDTLYKNAQNMLAKPNSYSLDNERVKAMQAATGITEDELNNYETKAEKITAIAKAYEDLYSNLITQETALGMTVSNLNELNNMSLMTDEAKSQSLIRLAAQYENCSDEVIDYTAIIKKYPKDSKEVKKALEEMAKAIKKAEWNKFSEDIADAAKGLSKIADPDDIEKNLGVIQKALKDSFNMDIPIENLAKYQDEFKKWAKASPEQANDIMAGIVNALSLDEATDGGTSLEIPVTLEDGTVMNVFDNITGGYEAVKNIVSQPLTVDAQGKADLTGIINSLMDANASAEQVAAILRMLGQTNVEVKGFGDNIDLTTFDLGTQEGIQGFMEALKNKRIDFEASGVAAGQTVGGGGGGGGGGPSTRQSSETKRYHRQQSTLEDISKQYDKISEAVDRAYGADKLKKIKDSTNAMENQIGILNEQIKVQEDLVNAIEKNLVPDKNKMLEEWDKIQQLSGNKLNELIVDENTGIIQNWSELQQEIINYWNTLDKKKQDEFKEQESIFTGYLDLYEETHDLYIDESNALEQLKNEKKSLELEKLKYELEVKIEFKEDRLEYLEYQLEKIDDNAFAVAQAISLINEELAEYLDQQQVYEKGIKNILSLALGESQGEIAFDLALKGDYSLIQANADQFTADQIDELKNYRDSLLDINKNLRDLKENAFDKLTDAFDEWTEKLDDNIDILEHYGSVLDGFKNIIDVTGKKALGVSNELFNRLNESIVKNSLAQLDATKSKAESIQGIIATTQKHLMEAETRLEQAEKSGDSNLIISAQEDVKYWTDLLKDQNEQAMESSEELLDVWADTLEAIQTKFEASVEQAVEEFDNLIYADGGLDGLADSFEKQKELADYYLEDYRTIYELSKLTRDINRSIDDTKSIAGKQKLKGLLEDINKIHEEDLKMSEYDLEYMQAEYELRMAQIALEEAQNAKDTVRLQKDASGNYSYVYTNSTDAIDEAQQKYEDALYNMQDLSAQYIDEVSSQAIDAAQKMKEEILALDLQGLDPAEYEEKKQKIIDHYLQIISNAEQQINNVLSNNQDLYEQDIAWWEYATGKKQEITDDFVLSYKDSLLGVLFGSESEYADFGSQFGGAIKTLSDTLSVAFKEFLENSEKVKDAAGVAETFSDLLAGSMDSISDKTTEASDKIHEVALAMPEDFKSLAGEVGKFAEEYAANIEPIITASEQAAKGIIGIISALSDLDGMKINVDSQFGQINFETNLPSDSDPNVSAASGGYTGDWAGNSGRLLWVHPEELILNSDDTSNFLSALELTRRLVSVIDLNAQHASTGLGVLTPASVKEDKQILEQQVTITAEFPNVQDKNEIQEAFNNLINTASQYANRK